MGGPGIAFEAWVDNVSSFESIKTLSDAHAKRRAFPRAAILRLQCEGKKLHRLVEARRGICDWRWRLHSAACGQSKCSKHRDRLHMFPQAGVAFALLCAVGTLATGYGQESFESLLHRGYDLHQQARFAEAVPVLEQAHKLAPQDYFANLLLGIDLLRVDFGGDRSAEDGSADQDQRRVSRGLSG